MRKRSKVANVGEVCRSRSVDGSRREPNSFQAFVVRFMHVSRSRRKRATLFRRVDLDGLAFFVGGEIRADQRLVAR